MRLYIIKPSSFGEEIYFCFVSYRLKYVTICTVCLIYTLKTSLHAKQPRIPHNIVNNRYR